MQRRKYVRLGPIHDGAQLVPIIHVFEFDMFHRSTGDNKPVEVLILHLIEGAVKLRHVPAVGVCRSMGGGLQQHDIQLQGGIAQLAHQLCFGIDFRRHEIEDHQPQWTDILMRGTALAHNVYVFGF